MLRSRSHGPLIALLAALGVEACTSKDLNAPTGTEPVAAAGSAGMTAFMGPPNLVPLRPDVRSTGGAGGVSVQGSGGAGPSGGVSSAGAGGVAGSADASGGVPNTGGAAGSPPVSTICGDGIRDPLTEECDDGPGDAEDLCTPDCHARAIVYPPLGGPVWRNLEPSRHVSSAGAEGFAVVHTLSSPLRVFMSRFDAAGRRVGTDIEVSSGANPAGDPNPGVAALPNGRYAVAWTDNNGGPRAAFRIIQADGQLGGVIHAPSLGSANGRDVDLLWTGDELVIAWEMDHDLSLRRFDANGAPLADTELLAASAALETSVVLASLGSGYAQAWRSGTAGRESIVVHTNGALWSTDLAWPGPAYNRPAIVQLDATRLLLVYAENTDPINLGIQTVGRLRAAILDVAAPGPVQSFPLPPLVGPYSDPTISQERPSLARVGGKIYLSWQSGNVPGDSLGSEVWLSELAWSSGEPTVLTRTPEVPLGGAASRLGPQQEPAISAAPLLSNGALITTFETGSGASTELVVAFRAVPLTFLSMLQAN